MLDAVLLEWEGVLADTTVARREAMRRALADEGVQSDALGGDPALADLVALRATRAFAERIGKGLVLLPGARAFVERVQIASRVAIVTSATRAETEFMLRLAGLDGAVATIVSADDRLEGAARSSSDCAPRACPSAQARSRRRTGLDVCCRCTRPVRPMRAHHCRRCARACCPRCEPAHSLRSTASLSRISHDSAASPSMEHRG